MTQLAKPHLETERLTIRWLREADAVDLFEVYGNKDAMRYWSTLPMQSVSEAQQMIVQEAGDFSAATGMRLGIEHKADAKLIGTCSLFNIDLTCRRAEVGYILAPAYWRQGLMTEALNAILTYAFETRNFNRIEADIDPRNIASAKSLERQGFQLEGTLRERWVVNGEVSDSGLYGLLKREWQELNGR